MKTHVLKAISFGIVAAGLASPVAAADGIAGRSFVAPEKIAAAEAELSSPAEAAEAQAPLDAPKVSDEELQGQRGGQAIQIANQTMTAITSGNVLNGDYTAGDVTLSDNALASFNGVGNLLINTGAQVSLQSGMNLTINVGE